jgi:hypothetical protein
MVALVGYVVRRTAPKWNRPPHWSRGRWRVGGTRHRCRRIVSSPCS